MRLAIAVLVATTGVARAEPSLSEWGAGEPLRPATQLVESACDMDVEVRGAIADVEVHQRIVNPGPGTLGIVEELELPAAAQLIGMALRGDHGTETAIAVSAGFAVEGVTNPAVIGADQAIAQALEPAPNGRARFRVIIEPIETDRDVVVTTHWTAITEIRNGALHLVLPGRPRDAKLAVCRVTVHAQVGPGATIARIAVAGTDVGTRGAASFVLDASDVAIAIELGFAQRDPIAWLQTEPLGDGWSARAVTILAPPIRAIGPRHALLVIDGSRSMELVGRQHVVRVVHELGAALPQGSEVEAIVFDRNATRVLGGWRPADASNLAAIEKAIVTRAAGNGSDVASALKLARKVIDDEPRGQTMVIVITDGIFGNIPETALAQALAKPGPKDLDFYAIALEPGALHSSNAEALRRPVTTYGGTYIEVGVDDLDLALTGVAGWLRPSWLQLALSDGREVPQLLAGTGTVMLGVARRSQSVVITGDHKITIAARPAITAPIAQLVLATTIGLDFSSSPATTATASEEAAGILEHTRLTAHSSGVDAQHALVVLATTGKVARDRRAMIAGGGPYTRTLAIDDPKFPPDLAVAHAAPNAATTPAVGGSALDHTILRRMLTDQLDPRAFSCYQHELGRVPNLAGTVDVQVEVARGEITSASVKGLGDAVFDACLLDAVYGMTPPMPNPSYNVDDRTLVTYPITFNVRAEKPNIVPGDADSSSPLDIDAIKGGVPRGPIKAVDSSTPLGNLRPSPIP